MKPRLKNPKRYPAALLLAGTMLAAIWAGQGAAQNPASPAAPGSPPCSPSTRPGAPGMPPPDSGTPPPPAPATENLSERLARSDGVICPPPGVDPEIKLPTPETGSNTPIIPPPGSPGGDPTIRPK